MFERHENIRDLIVKQIRNEITPEEHDQLQEWITASGDNRQLFEELTSLPLLYQKLNDCDRYTDEKDIVWEKIDKDPEGRLSFLKSRRWLPYAAAAVVVLIAGYLIMSQRFTKQSTPEVKQPQIAQHDIEPGKYKAMLTLDNGQKIKVDSAIIGQLAQQGTTQVLNKNGQLVYTPSAGSSKGAILWNTLSTTKGQTYTIKLSDNSLVTCNAESSIRFPVNFTGNTREVQVTGEVFFQVAHDASKPFIVKVKNMELQVLGTTFNVNAYDDEEAIKTTLVEGKVKVLSTTNNAQVILAPGEQAILRQAQDDKAILSKTKDIDVDAEVAWRFGYFQFNGVDIHAVMRQLERWYDVQTNYVGTVNHKFLGDIPRNMTLSQVMDLLREQGIRYKIEGKKITVSPE